MILGECKFWQEPVGLNVLRDLEQKAERVPWEKPRRKNWFVLFSANGFTDELRQLAAARSDILLVDDH